MTEEQERISAINREKAAKFFNLQKGYVLHHKDHTLRHNDIERYILWNPEDLIVMLNGEHSSLHWKLDYDERRKKISNSLIGHEVSEDTRQKLREANLGKKNGPASEETKRKISEALRGEKNGANTHPEKNNFINDNPAKKLKGTHYYNNGITEIRAKECPEGFTKGRLPGCFGRGLSNVFN